MYVFALLEDVAGSDAVDLLEASGEMALVSKACLIGDSCDGGPGKETPFGMLQANMIEVSMRRQSQRLVKDAYQVIGREASDLRKVRKRDIVCKVCFEVIARYLNSSRLSADRPHHDGMFSVVSEQIRVGMQQP